MRSQSIPLQSGAAGDDDPIVRPLGTVINSCHNNRTSVNIYVDESGSFANSTTRGSWNVVVALAAAETGRKAIAKAVRLVRKSAGAHPEEEVKLKHVAEHSYLEFLGAMRHHDLLIFATATDAGMNSTERVARHQRMQVAKIREAIPCMRHEAGRLAVELLASQVESISPQLYVQLVCQVNLLCDVLNRSINFFAQRRPATLREFRWRIDQKNTARTTFEDAFEKIAPMLLQTRSIKEPFSKVEGFDYSAMKAYEFELGKGADYLQTVHGFPDMDSLNLQKIIRGNMEFVDSKSLDGVQAVDLIASGLRRLLRGEFSDNKGVARGLSRLFVQAQRGSSVISLVTMAPEEASPSPYVTDMIRTINNGSKRMLAQTSGV